MAVGSKALKNEMQELCPRLLSWLCPGAESQPLLPGFRFLTTHFYGEEHGSVLLTFYGLAENWRCREGRTTRTCKRPQGFNLLPGV